MINPVLLITSSIKVHAEQVKLVNENERLSLTLEAIKKWQVSYPGIKIVLCDGSNYNFNSLLNQYKSADIEFISFNNDYQKIIKQGKGYGEGEIISYALKKSKLLKDAEYFTKITGRLFIKNYKTILSNFQQDILFELNFKNKYSLINIEPYYVSTRFYIVSKDFYIEHLRDLRKNVCESRSYCIEDAFKDTIVNKNLINIKYLITNQILLEGKSGTDNTDYVHSESLLKNQFRNIRKWIILCIFRLNLFLKGLKWIIIKKL